MQGLFTQLFIVIVPCRTTISDSQLRHIMKYTAAIDTIKDTINSTNVYNDEDDSFSFSSRNKMKYFKWVHKFMSVQGLFEMCQLGFYCNLILLYTCTIFPLSKLIYLLLGKYKCHYLRPILLHLFCVQAFTHEGLKATLLVIKCYVIWCCNIISCHGFVSSSLLHLSFNLPFIVLSPPFIGFPYSQRFAWR